MGHKNLFDCKPILVVVLPSLKNHQTTSCGGSSLPQKSSNHFLWWFFPPSKIIKPLLVMVLHSPSQEPSIWVLRTEIKIGHGTKTKQHWFGFGGFK
jgi:hypothetical protein